MTCLTPLLTLAWLELRHDWSRALVLVAAWFQFAIIAPGAIVNGLHVAGSQVWKVPSLVIAVREAPFVTALAFAVFVAGTTLTLSMITEPSQRGPRSRAMGG
jgi:hypothetical protein